MIFPLLAAVGGFAGGSLVTRVALDRRHRRDLIALDRAMTRQIRLRYEAYLELEEKIARMTERFGRQEAASRALLDEQHAQIEVLTREIEEHAVRLEETSSSSRSAAAAEHSGLSMEHVSGWVFEQQDEEAQGERACDDEAPVAGPERDSEVYQFVEVSHAEPRAKGSLDMDLEDFERRLQSVQVEKQAQLERQRSLIAELTECVTRLKPMPAVLRERESELVEAHRRMDALDRESADRAAALEERLEELDRRLADECERRRNEVAVLQESYRELEQRKESEIEALHTRMHELEEVRREAETLRARLAETERELEAARSERDARVEEVRSLTGRVGEMSSQLADTEDSLSGQQTRIADLMRALETAEDDLESQKSTLEEHEQTLEQARSVVAELRPTIDSLEERLETWSESESDRDAD